MDIEMFENNEALKTFIEIIKLPDEQFDNVFPVLMEQANTVFNQTNVQKQIVDNLANFQSIDFDAETKALEDTIKEIESSEELSQNKKDFLIAFLNKSKEATIALYQNPRMRVEVKITKLNPDAVIPSYAHPTDCGADVSAVEETKLEAGETKIVKTGLAVAVPAGYEIQVRPRSGLSLKSGLRIANTPGTIDADYRGEIGIIMTNTKDIPYVIDKGMKIAQLVIAPTPMINWVEVSSVEALGNTERGIGGFGSTDSKS